MKKHVFEITAITVALIVAFTAAFAAIFVRTCPKAVADMAKRTGNMELSLKYREKSYLKSNDYNELALLCEAAIGCDDYKKTVTYAETFIASDKFIDYCGEKGIPVVTMDVSLADEESLAFFKDKGIKVYVNTLNKISKMTAAVGNLGVDGFYSDYITDSQLKNVLGTHGTSREDDISYGEY